MTIPWVKSYLKEWGFGENCFFSVNSEPACEFPAPKIHSSYTTEGEKKKMQLEDKVCISVKAEQGSAGTSLLTSCFCSCSLVARLVWCQPRSPEQSQSQEFAHPGAAQGGTNRNTSAAPLFSFSVTFITLFFPSFFLFWLFITPRAAVRALKRLCPNSDQQWKFSRFRDPLWQLSPENWPQGGHCWSACGLLQNECHSIIY